MSNISNNLIKTQLPSELVKATISIEDKRFYAHYGHDLFSIFRAIICNLFQNRLQGASTIEQQLIRIILRKNELTFMRKYFEITLSTEINKRFSKLEIIHHYLNCYLFRPNIVGINSLCAIEGYPIDKLTIKDVCELAARFKYPNVTIHNYIRYLKRVRTIEIINKSCK